MKISFNQADLNLLMPEARRLKIPPHQLIKAILHNYFNTPFQEGNKIHDTGSISTTTD